MLAGVTCFPWCSNRLLRFILIYYTLYIALLVCIQIPVWKTGPKVEIAQTHELEIAWQV